LIVELGVGRLLLNTHTPQPDKTVDTHKTAHGHAATYKPCHDPGVVDVECTDITISAKTCMQLKAK